MDALYALGWTCSDEPLEAAKAALQRGLTAMENRLRETEDPLAVSMADADVFVFGAMLAL